MIGLGLFIPNGDTPLAEELSGTSLNKEERMIALNSSGANVVMPNVMEGEYRQLYQLYSGKICINEIPAHCRRCITDKIMEIGRQIP